MLEAQKTPPLRWLAGDAGQRRKAWRYWVSDTAIGLVKVTAHYAMRVLPIAWCSAIGGFLGPLSRRSYPRSDARFRKAWMRLRPEEADPQSVEAASRRLWRSIGRTMAEFSVVHRLWKEGHIEIEGMADLEAARATGKPLIGAALHLGNWEAIPSALFALGYKGVGVYLRPENRFEHHIAMAIRKRHSVEMIETGPSTTRLTLQSLKTGKHLWFPIDEFARGRVQSPSFGRPLASEGSNIAYVVRLAMMSGALVIPVYAVRLGDSARFRITFLPALQMQDSGDRKADAVANVARLDALIEPIVRRHLDQWFYVLDLDLDK